MQRPEHISDELLLRYRDGELAALDASRVGEHLVSCALCQERSRKIAKALAGWEAAVQAQSREEGSPSGPRALLRARLAEESAKSSPRLWLRPRLARTLAYACALALLMAMGVRVSRQWMRGSEVSSSRPLPDPRITPGATRLVSVSELCSVDRDDVVRTVSVQKERQVFQEYGIGGIATADFEVDYLITPGLGGTDDVRNLWPEPHSNTMWNSYVKDQLEDHLHRLVCGNQLRLDEAQREIAGDWIAAYKKYFHTDRPLADTQPHSIAKL